MHNLKIDPAWNQLVKDNKKNNFVDNSYIDFVVKWPFSYYISRLKKIKFEGYDKVLDVGCGLGQWTIALAACNKQVVGIDVNIRRVNTCNQLIQSLWLNNAEAYEGSAVNIAYPDESFDAIFCYGVFMFLNKNAALSEFNRVLKPGGRIYVCTNARGWWLELAIKNLFKNRSLAWIATKSFFKGRNGVIPSAIDIADVPSLLSPYGYNDVKVASEGMLCFDKSLESVKPVYKNKYLFFDSVIELSVVKGALKNSITGVENGVLDFIKTNVASVANASHYSYSSCFDNYILVDGDLNDAVVKLNRVNFNKALVGFVDRIEILKWIFVKATENKYTNEEVVVACVTFAQKYFYHHFAVQPMQDDVSCVYDPIETLLFGACRCGSVARFLYDLFDANDYDCHLLGAGAHTAAEVFIGGRWVLLDANLFPPGVIPKNEIGELVSLDDISRNHFLIDSIPSYINYESNHISLYENKYPSVYAEIKNWLINPILPSVAYFGEDFLSENQSIRGLRRWKKRKKISEYSFDRNAGWLDIVEVESFTANAIPTIQRPRQVSCVEMIGAKIFLKDIQPDFSHCVLYQFVFSCNSRGWQYTNLPVGFDFNTLGMSVFSSDPEVDVPDGFLNKNFYLTVMARLASNLEAFVLPSNEFYF